MSNPRLVYSTEQGRVRAQAPTPSPPTLDDGPVGVRGAREYRDAESGRRQDPTIRIFRERAGRGGKTVTVIRGLPQRGEALGAQAAELRRLCGAGGTVKDGIIELQGDHRERILAHLRALGHRVKLAGG